MRVKITRYFERTRQIADFVPVKAACEASMEMETSAEQDFMKAAETCSAALDALVQAEVEKTLMGYVPCCVSCGGKPIYPKKDLSKGGECDTCINKREMEARQFKADNAKNRAGKGEQTVEY
jgi:hypothetical protein